MADPGCRATCVRRENEMKLDFTDQDLEFRDEVRRFIAEHYPAEVRERQQRGLELRKQDYLAWHQVVARRDWSVPAWPVEYGGTGWTPTQHYLWNEELAVADTVPIISFGTGLVGPVIYTFGTAEQKARFLPDIVAGTVWWCQGYSEPGAGSDLASLQTRAVRDGDHYVVNGQKTWTTLGHFADWGFFLVRTDPKARKQSGISFLLIDMRSPCPCAICCCMRLTSSQARFSIHCVMGTICPVSSASGMKSAGITSPRVGWRQRISASTPTRWRVDRSTMGW